MNHSARRSGIPSTSLTFAALALAFVCRTSTAQVIEPNGTSVPTPTTMDPVSLQQYFTSVNESINVVANASITPATFMPLCNFQATLVLSQSSAQGGLAWYNVPDATTDPNHTQTPTVYPIGTFPMTVGTTVASADIRSNTNYGGGLVGFALLKNIGNGAIPVYYSEDTRNADCTGCTAAGMMPGYWKMMLSYESTVTSNEYYMAWEDWEGANTTTWFGNDGDFNDKVFAISGVTCEGGGVPCQTTMQGVCANGITQCVVGGTPTCISQIKPTAEKCDNLDNDCNGMVDDGTGLCPGNQVCDKGNCIDPCSTGEFACGPPLICVKGVCIDPGCENVTCNVGQVCHGGTCVGGCDGVQCPANQLCELGVCVDPCQGVTCNGSVCVLGVCVQNCSCQACPKGQICSATGACVDDGCDTITCDKSQGQVCSNGSCVDACAGAKCPGGADCHNGQCDPPPPPPAPTGAGGSTATGGAGGTIGGTGGSGGKGGTSGGKGGSGAGGTLATGGSTGATGSGGSGPHEAGVVSCNCTSAGPGGSGGALLLALMAFAAFFRRRARR